MSGTSRFNLKNHCYHVTTATKDRAPIFERAENALLVVQALHFVREREWTWVLAYCVMPDHLHALLAPRGERTLSQVMQSIKGYVSRQINERDGTRGAIWQQSFYDRAIRDDIQLATAFDYIHFNPVRDGLVTTPSAYQFSSASPNSATDVEAWSR